MQQNTQSRPPVAAIVLAAGGSVRMGRLKQLLPIAGQPMVRRVVENVCAAGLSQIIVVVGAQAEDVSRALTGLTVEVVYNRRWAEGMSTSLQSGLSALRPENQAVLIVLADQPGLGPELVRALVGRYYSTKARIVLPEYSGQRGHPVLFDRGLFHELMQTQGDQGGRALLASHLREIERLEVDDPAVTLDLDLLQDYEKALSSGSLT